MSVLFLSLFILNIYWCYAIVRMVIKVLKGGSMPAEKPDEEQPEALNESADFGRAKE